MARTDKLRGFRPITVNDEKYLWRITWADEHTRLEIQYAGMKNGQRLMVDLHAKREFGLLGGMYNLDENRHNLIVRPKFVRESVLYGLEHGWTPHITAPTLKIDAHEANLPFAELTKSPFDVVIDDIMSHTPSIDDKNLQGFTTDLRCALVQAEYFNNLNIQYTDNPRCTLIANGELSPTCDHLQAGAFIKKQWLEKICCKGFEAHQIVYKPETIDFRFVTISKNANYCVTGKIVINRY